mmetsp:Transcript_101318/g.254036  ORF Transcript_101318/g.254036 Transcript_101318/m.254036 type:complete len:91 (-) Transcript_101318:59-331(-)
MRQLQPRPLRREIQSERLIETTGWGARLTSRMDLRVGTILLCVFEDPWTLTRTVHDAPPHGATKLAMSNYPHSAVHSSSSGIFELRLANV